MLGWFYHNTSLSENMKKGDLAEDCSEAKKRDGKHTIVRHGQAESESESESADMDLP